jgi:hypothetical protein
LIGRSSSTDTEDHEYGTLYNYADDNTLSYVNDNYEKLIDILEQESSVLIDWFTLPIKAHLNMRGRLIHHHNNYDA